MLQKLKLLVTFATILHSQNLFNHLFKMLKFFSWHWDLVGFGASLLCALHCVLLPFLFTLGMFSEKTWLVDPLSEWIFIGLSAWIACWSLLSSYFKKHRNIRPLIIAGIGFLGLIIAQKLVVSDAHWLMTAGGGLIAYAHFCNWKLMHQPKTSKVDKTYWVTPGRVVTFTLLLLYFWVLHSALVQNNTPPSREEVLQIIWRVQD